MSAMSSAGYASRRANVVDLAPVRVRSARQRVAGWREVLSHLAMGWRVLRLRPLLARSFYPSVRAVRLGDMAGIDGLFYEVLNRQFILESGVPLPTDLGLADLAVARADMLPRAFARREVRLLFEQHVVARLHVLLVEGNYRVEAWLRAHHRNSWFTTVWSVVVRLILRRHRDNDPVSVLRLDPDAFSAFVWEMFAALPELEDVLNSAVPVTGPPSAEEVLDSDAATAAVKVAAALDTDHAGWAQPAKLLRDLHGEIRAAMSLAPRDKLVRHVFGRVEHAVKRLADFDEAYERGTAQDPLPEWVSTALEAVDSPDLERLDAESATKLVRRISCRLWATGSYRLAEVKPLAPLSAPDPSPSPPAVVEQPAPAPLEPAPRDEEVETGF